MAMVPLGLATLLPGDMVPVLTPVSRASKTLWRRERPFSWTWAIALLSNLRAASRTVIASSSLGW